MAAKIRRDDEVSIITGKDKGKTGKVLRVISRNHKKLVFVEGINLVKKHQKPNPAASIPGGILSQEAPLDVSNVAIYNPTTGKPDRVGFRFEAGKKVRFFKSNGEIIR